MRCHGILVGVLACACTVACSTSPALPVNAATPTSPGTTHSSPPALPVPTQTADHATGQPGTIKSRITAPVTVAVIDSGISDLPELHDSVWWAHSRSFVPGQSLADADGHGTEMAVIIHRAAPTARLLALKALDDRGNGSDAATARAIRYAVEQRARIVNLSAASNAPEPKMRAAIEFAASHGTLVVTAAGNDAIDTDVFPTYPASYRLPNVIGVAATDGLGEIAANSNWGRRSITIGALGLDVPTASADPTTTSISGSSAAAAITTGVAANVLSHQPHTTSTRLRHRLLATATAFPALKKVTVTGRQLGPS